MAQHDDRRFREQTGGTPFSSLFQNEHGKGDVIQQVCNVLTSKSHLDGTNVQQNDQTADFHSNFQTLQTR